MTMVRYFKPVCIFLTIIALAAIALFVLTACGAPAASSSSQAVSPSESTELVLTIDELAKYNGKDGNPAYIAVDGVIYDVTNVPQWRNGDHNGFTAGKDLTKEIKTISPHGVAKLKGLPVVGKLK